MIADRIGNRMAFETYLEAQVLGCISNLDTYYTDTLSNNMNLLPTAQNDVTTKLAELKEIIGMTMESDEDFKDRMMRMFMDEDAITPIPDVLPMPDIIVHDLPDNAPPAVVTNMNMLAEFRESLIDELTFAMWLMDKKATECNAIVDEFTNRLDAQRKSDVDMNIIALLADLKETRANSPTETDSAFGGRMRDELDQALISNTIATTQSGIIIPTLPTTCDSIVDSVQASIAR